MIRSDKKGEKVMEYQELLSVGCLLTKDLKVFPINCNEPAETASEADEYMGVHVYDLTNEWYNNLDADDLIKFFKFIELNTEVVAVVYNDWKQNIWSEWEEANNCYMNLAVEEAI